MFNLHKGDCLPYMKTLQSASIDCVVTDPPYNASVENSDLVGILKDRRPGKNAGKREYGKWDYDYNPVETIKEIDRLLSSNSQAYVFCSSHLVAEWVTGLKGIFDGVRILNWAKPDPVPSVRQRHWCSANELIIWAWRGKYVFNYLGHQAMFSWQLYPSPKDNTRVHPTQKPIDLVKKLVSVSSLPNQIILDPFMGSGTTGVSCVELGRRFIGCEIDPKYFSIAEKRIKSAALQPGLFTPSNTACTRLGGTHCQKSLFSTDSEPATGDESKPAPSG